MIVLQQGNNIVSYTRDELNNVIKEVLSGFQPYFYVGVDEEIPVDKRIVRLEDTHKKTLGGKSVKKVIIRNQFEIAQMRNLFGQTYEADIKHTWRHWIDNVKVVPQENLRKCFFDIETKEMPSVQLDNSPITCIGLMDSYTNKYFTFIINGIESTEERENHTIYHCTTEYMVLDKFIKHVSAFDYDMFIAHNGSRFDYPVIIGRMEKLQVLGYGKLARIGSVKRENMFGEWRTRMDGRILFDFLGPKTNFGTAGGIRGLLDGRDITIKGKDGEDRIVRIKRWSLAYLAQFVGMQKGKYNKVETLEEMITYNKLDVAIMVALDKFFNVTEYYHNMQCLIGCPYEVTYFNSSMIDIFLMKRFPQYVFPTKPARGEASNEETIKGADVTEPIAGIYQKIDVVDQTSLYPSVIVSYNMSPETVDPEGDIIVGNGIRFTSKRIGIIPDAVKFLLDIRLKYKKLSKSEPDPYKAQMYDLLSNGYKTLLVSFYGILLYKGFRLFDHAVAEAIPYTGRVIKTQHVQQICESHGYEIVFGDTDSSALNAIRPDATPIDELVDIINESFTKFTMDRGIKNHILHMELDKSYSPIIVSDKKKRYVGYLLKNGKKIYKSTGFESVRRDASPITEEMQEAVFKLILGGANRKVIEVYIEKLYADIKAGKYPMEMLGLPKGFSKDFNKFKVKSQWITGVEYANRHLGMSFDKFSEIQLFHVKQAPEGKEHTNVVSLDVENIDLINDFVIDWAVQLDKLIGSKVQNIYDMLKWIPSQQRTLSEY